MDDMPRRNDLLLTNPDIVTGIMRHIQPNAPIVFFSSFLGNQMGADETMFEAAPQGLGVGFIRLKEYKQVYEPVRVTKNSLVPATITAQVPFEVSSDFFLEQDEQFLAKDEVSMFRVLSSRPTGQGADLTIVFDAMPGETVSGSLFGINDPINHGYGNSKGEGSTNSNTFIGDSLQFNTFFNPMKITRRRLDSTGSAMADESEYYSFTLEEEQGVFKDYYTDIPISFFRQVVQEYSDQLLYSRANFDPATRRIAGVSQSGKYHERPSYAGIYQQLDEVRLRYFHNLRGENNTQLLAKIDRILQELFYANGNVKTTVTIVGKGAGIRACRDAFRWAVTNKFGTTLQIQMSGDAGKINAGWEMGDYVTDYGRVVLYDMGASNRRGEFDKVSHGGIDATPREMDLYFIPAVSVDKKSGRRKKPVSIYYRQSNRGGYGNVSRGMVFGTVNGLTGQGNGMSFDQLQNIQDSAIRTMMESQSYEMNSTFDGKESHVLYESVPYIDIAGIVRMTLIP